MVQMKDDMTGALKHCLYNFISHMVQMKGTPEATNIQIIILYIPHGSDES